MTIEEGTAEFARIMEPLIREHLERKAETVSAGGTKGPKDSDDEDLGVPEKHPKPGEGAKKKRKKK